MLGLAITRAYGPDALQANFAIITLHAPFCYGLGITVMEIVRNSGKSLWYGQECSGCDVQKCLGHWNTGRFFN